MKTIAIISLFLATLGVQSCQSEYSERMKKAIELKQKHTDIKSIMSESKNSNLKPILLEIEREIKFQAEISGNEELFLEQLWKK